MKFILTEKYSLQEPKFILDERFILNEGATVADTKLELENVLKTYYSTAELDKIKYKLTEKSKSNLDKLNKLSSLEKAVLDQKNSGDLNIEKLEELILEYIAKYEEIIRKEDINKFPNIKTAIEKIKQYINYTPSNDPEDIERVRTNLLANFENLANLTKTVLNTSIAGVKEDEVQEIDKAISELNTAKQECIEVIKNNKTTKIDQVKYNSQLNSAVSTLDNESKKTKTTLKDYLDSFNVCTTAIKDLTTNINSSFTELDNNEREAKDTAERKVANDKDKADLENAANWDKKYNNAVNLEAFWNEYFKTEFPWVKNDLIKVRLEEEIDDFGFSEARNAYIYYLKNVDDKIKTRLNDSKYAYNELHNAVENKLLNEGDLRTGGALGKTNIIYCPNLYIKSAADMTEYFEQQWKVLNNINTKEDASNKVDRQYVANGVINKDVTQKFFQNLFYDGGSVLPTTAGQTNGNLEVLKPIAQIKNEIKIIFNETDRKEIESKEDIERQLHLWGLDNITDKDTAGSIIAYFIEKMNAANRNSFINDHKELGKFSTSTELISKYKLPSKWESIRISADNLKTMLLRIAENAKIIKPEEKEENK